jgi:hypothetical protein
VIANRGRRPQRIQPLLPRFWRRHLRDDTGRHDRRQHLFDTLQEAGVHACRVGDRQGTVRLEIAALNQGVQRCVVLTGGKAFAAQIHVGRTCRVLAARLQEGHVVLDAVVRREASRYQLGKDQRGLAQLLDDLEFLRHGRVGNRSSLLSRDSISVTGGR